MDDISRSTVSHEEVPVGKLRNRHQGGKRKLGWSGNAGIGGKENMKWHEGG